jgi:RNA polymerase sigma factor (sigma-70 family)
MSENTPFPAAPQQFPLTRWSVVEAARGPDTRERQRALDTLITAYWKPIYKYVRLHWHKDPDQAADLTQDFFVKLLEKKLLDRFDPARARLRTYLRLCADGLVMNADKSAQRLKRGGAVVLVPLDFETAEGELQSLALPAARDPEEFFAREFARSLFANAVEQVRARCEQEHKLLHFQIFELYDIEGGAKELTYEEVGSRFGIKATDVTNYLAFARREFRKCILDELRKMTATDDEFRREALTLLGLKLA